MWELVIISIELTACAWDIDLKQATLPPELKTMHNTNAVCVDIY